MFRDVWQCIGRTCVIHPDTIVTYDKHIGSSVEDNGVDNFQRERWNTLGYAMEVVGVHAHVVTASDATHLVCTMFYVGTIIKHKTKKITHIHVPTLQDIQYHAKKLSTQTCGNTP